MKSFLQGKKPLGVSALRPPAAPAASPSGMETALGAHPHGHGPASASVDVIKEGDKVVRLIVTCGCGERVEVECLYPAGS